MNTHTYRIARIQTALKYWLFMKEKKQKSNPKIVFQESQNIMQINVNRKF